MSTWSTPRSWSGTSVAGRPAAAGVRGRRWHPVPPPGVVPIRQLAFFELLDGGLRVIRANPRSVLGPPALVSAVVAVLGWVIGAVLIWSVTELGIGLALDDAGFVGLQLVVQALASVLGLLSYASVLLFAGTSAHAVQRGLFGEKPRLRDSWRALRGSRLRLLGLTAVFAVGQLLALLILCLPAAGAGILLGSGIAAGLLVLAGLGLWLLFFAFCYVRFAPAGAALIWEGLGLWAALRRSWALTGRGFLRLLGLHLTGGFLSSTIISLVITPVTYVLMVVALLIAFTLEDDASALIALLVGVLAVISGLGTFVSALLFAYMGGIAVLAYLDQRIRLEGYDIVLLAEAERLAAERERDGNRTIPGIMPGAVP